MAEIQEYILTLQAEFERNFNSKNAVDQKAYMRNQFEFFGLKAEQRRALQKPFLLKVHLPDKSKLTGYVKELWQMPQRDFHYFAQELAFKYVKQQELQDMALYGYMVEHNAWWDTVDFIAVKLMGAYFKKFPEQRLHFSKQWLESGNFWLQRCALLFQLKYKEQLDTVLLESTIQYLLGSKEFFINKAIGWVLREYSRTNPVWVRSFCDRTDLHALSRREALRLMK